MVGDISFGHAGCMTASAMRAPCAASALTAPAPLPPAAPVTSATRPARACPAPTCKSAAAALQASASSMAPPTLPSQGSEGLPVPASPAMDPARTGPESSFQESWKWLGFAHGQAQGDGGPRRGGRGGNPLGGSDQARVVERGGHGAAAGLGGAPANHPAVSQHAASEGDAGRRGVRGADTGFGHPRWRSSHGCIRRCG